MKHKAYDKVIKLVKNNIPVLLEGEAGTGKSTIFKDIAQELELEYFPMIITRQTTISSLIGFMALDGEYKETHLIHLVREGGLLVLEELNAGDPNLLIIFNSLENGFLTTPAGIIPVHENFRLAATQNPKTDAYTGRAVSDYSTRDRFDTVIIEMDKAMLNTIDSSVIEILEEVNEKLNEYNKTRKLGFRDYKRAQQRKDAQLLDADFIKALMDGDETLFKELIDSWSNPDPTPKGDIITIRPENLEKGFKWLP